jgi:predicted  nucleic acid-binding Zn-ribbon protein
MFLKKAKLVDSLNRDLADARNKRDSFAARVTTLTAQIAELEVRLSAENERLERERAALEIVAIKKRVEDSSSKFTPAIAQFRDATEVAATIVPEVREFNESLDLIATKVVNEIDGLLVELDRRIEAAHAGKAATEPQQLLTWCPESAQTGDRVHSLPVKLTKEEAAEDRSSTATAKTPRRKNPEPRLSHEV